MLAINNIEVVYDRVILVLKGVSIDVGEGAITTLLGANGAGKTTTLEGDLRRAALASAARSPRAPSSSATGASTACGRTT